MSKIQFYEVTTFYLISRVHSILTMTKDLQNVLPLIIKMIKKSIHECVSAITASLSNNGDKKQTVLLKFYENNGDSPLIFDISLESSIVLIMHAINTILEIKNILEILIDAKSKVKQILKMNKYHLIE